MWKETKEDNNRAVVAAFVYNRPDKTRAMFESLKNNIGAGDSRIFVFSDAAKNDKAKEAVSRVRQYVGSLGALGWFKEVTVIEAETNKGLAGSVIEGVSNLLDRYGRIIVLEDDLVLSPYFLSYMNECLKHYRDDKRIWSIDGYSYNPVKPAGYDKDVYLTLRASSWGWGTWKDRWDLVDWNVSDYGSFKYNPFANIRFAKGGNDMPSMLRAQMKGRIDSWAIRWCYAQFKQGMYSVAPMHSLVGNSGLDGSGTNCLPGDEGGRGSVDIDNEKRQWTVPGLEADRRLIRDFYKRHHLSLYIRVRDKIRQLKG